MATMERQSMRLTLERLCEELLTAVDDGDWGVREASRLHAWMRAEFLPWFEQRENEADDLATAAAIRSDRGVLLGLNSLLMGARGDEAAKWTKQIARVGMIALTRLELPPSSTQRAQQPPLGR